MKRGMMVAMSVVVIAVVFGYSNFLFAMEYPARAIELIVAFSAGGSSSMSARVVAQTASEILGKPVVILNKPGAGGSLAGAYVARAKRDGYTLLAFNSATNGVAPAIRTNIGYKNSDFRLIAQYGVQNWAIIAKADAPWKDIKDVIEYAKKNPGSIKCATSGKGGTAEFFLELLKAEAGGVKIDAVPFKGGSEMTNALLGGHVHLSTPALSEMKGIYEAGKIKVLGIASAERDPDFPNDLTFKEQGFPKVIIQSWYGIAAPAGVPEEIMNKLNEVFAKAIQHPETLTMLNNLGFMPTYRNADDFAKYVKGMEQMYSKVAKEAGIKLE